MPKLFEIFKKHMPSPTEVVEIALRDRFMERMTPEYVKGNFSSLVEKLQVDAYNVYLKEQKHYGQIAINDYLVSSLPEKASANKAISIAALSFDEFDRFFLSLTQSRRQRAGSAFEDIIRTLFKKLSYPFDEQQVINGKPDFLMPNRAHYDRNAMDCIIFTAKRTLRERWRQIVTEGTRGLGFYLATIDDSVSENQLDEMRRNRIYLVLPASIRKKVKCYSKAPNVITFEEFFRHHLDPAVKRWKKSKAC